MSDSTGKEVHVETVKALFTNKTRMKTYSGTWFKLLQKVFFIRSFSLV